VQAIMADAFRPVRQREWKSEPTVAINNDPAMPEAGQGARCRTPQSTIDALMWLLCENGLGCLFEQSNRDRLRCCDVAAMKQISARLLDLKSRSKGRLSDWTEENVAKLVSAWTVIGRNA
jgi:hypothetical protein